MYLFPDNFPLHNLYLFLNIYIPHCYLEGPQGGFQNNKIRLNCMHFYFVFTLFVSCPEDTVTGCFIKNCIYVCVCTSVSMGWSKWSEVPSSSGCIHIAFYSVDFCTIFELSHDVQATMYWKSSGSVRFLVSYLQKKYVYSPINPENNESKMTKFGLQIFPAIFMGESWTNRSMHERKRWGRYNIAQWT